MILHYQNISRTFGHGNTAQPALRGVELGIEPGAFTALMGASGSGKTTLLNLAAGFDRPDSGTVFLLGRDLYTLNETARARLRRQKIGFVFQTLNLIPTLTAAENVGLPLALNGRGRRESERRVDALLERAGLADRKNAFPTQLSGGQQQRIAALRAVAHRPALVLLDEPTSNLDSENGHLLLDLLTRLNEDENVTLLMATHDKRIAARAGSIVKLMDGQINDGPKGIVEGNYHGRS